MFIFEVFGSKMWNIAPNGNIESLCTVFSSKYRQKLERIPEEPFWQWEWTALVLCFSLIYDMWQDLGQTGPKLLKWVATKSVIFLSAVIYIYIYI